MRAMSPDLDKSHLGYDMPLSHQIERIASGKIDTPSKNISQLIFYFFQSSVRRPTGVQSIKFLLKLIEDVKVAVFIGFIPGKRSKNPEYDKTFSKVSRFDPSDFIE
jgi:hypothetical protein